MLPLFENSDPHLYCIHMIMNNAVLSNEATNDEIYPYKM